MRVRIAVTAALVGALTASAGAMDFPMRKAGLWSVSMNMEGMKMPSTTTKMCIDANTDAKMMKYGMHMNNDCSPPNIQGMGPVRTIDSVCHINGSTLRSHTVMTFTGGASYHMDMQSESSPPMYGRGKTHMTQDAKWMGPCPAGWRAGDMQINGMKMNVLDSMSNPMMGNGKLTPAQIQAIIKAHQHG